VVTVYNVHTLWEEDKTGYRSYCEVPGTLTLAESGESQSRFKTFFSRKLHRFKFFHGYTLPHPSSTIQQVFMESYLNESLFVPLVSFGRLVRGAAYVASDCHKSKNLRHQLVADIKDTGFRVDGLGRCHTTKIGPEGLQLSRRPEDRYNLPLKRRVISNYMFVLAFENTDDPGYVTEKVFDALLAGSFVQQQ
jgi:hypothetical protein